MGGSLWVHGTEPFPPVGDRLGSATLSYLTGFCVPFPSTFLPETLFLAALQDLRTSRMLQTTSTLCTDTLGTATTRFL